MSRLNKIVSGIGKAISPLALIGLMGCAPKPPVSDDRPFSIESLGNNVYRININLGNILGNNFKKLSDTGPFYEYFRKEFGSGNYDQTLHDEIKFSAWVSHKTGQYTLNGINFRIYSKNRTLPKRIAEDISENIFKEIK